MTLRGRGALGAALAALALAVPGSASAHAYLVRTVPSPSTTLNVSPPVVALTFDEAVEPRFAIISVTNAAGRQEATGPPRRSPANPDTLVVPLRPHLPEGWYLVYWRAISVDGHPVQGAYTFAIGPNEGPAPQFRVPTVAGTATTHRLLVARWAMFLTVMIAIGLFVMRIAIARPLVRRVEGTSLRSVSIAMVVFSVLGLIAIPVYLDIATSIDSLRSAFAVGALVPLFRVTAFGRGYVDMELCFALFCIASWIAVWVDRPRREHRSIAELMATWGALAAAAAVLVFPGTSGHAGQTAPRGLSLLLDWLHLASGSLWLGGLVGLLVVWASLSAGSRVAGLAVTVPRFSNVAFVSVLVLIGTGVGATIIHMPTVASLWQTSYGKTILLKVALLLGAMLLAAFNLLRTKPHLEAAAERPELGPPAASMLRRLVTGEAVIVAAAVFAAALLSSLAPPPKALASVGSAVAHVGPGKVVQVIDKNGYTIKVLVSPNRAAVPNSFALQLTRNGAPVRDADVTLQFAMLDMQMANQEYQLAETAPGLYTRPAPALVMVGRWALTYTITPKGGEPFSVLVVDHATG
ncbi:MAG TPA: copper resistance protein CopC [Gaiellaceae bacterium]|nr:copper resistance protein CopC [Gaiellaceae bacterium]